MIGKKSTGASFRGLQNYLLSGKSGTTLNPDRVAWADLRNLAMDDPELAYYEMQSTAYQSARSKKPVLHLSISPHPDVELSDEQLRQVAHRTLEDLGLGEHQALIVKHHDLERQHLHIMVNKVHPETFKTWKVPNDYALIDEVLDRRIAELGLEPVPRRSRPERTPHHDLSVSLSSEEFRHAQRTSREPFADLVRERVRPVMLESESWDQLREELAKERLWVEARGNGLVVTDGHEFAKASAIDRELSRRKVEERFGESHREFRARAGEVALLNPESLRERLAAGRDASIPVDDRRVAEVLARVSAGRSVFTSRQLERAAVAEGDDAPDLVRKAIASEQVVALPSRDAGGAEVFRFASREALEAEARVQVAAEDLRSGGGVAVEPSVTEAALRANAYGLGDAQSDAVRALAGESRLQIVRTSSDAHHKAVAQLADLHRGAGHRVVGVALSAQAAARFGEGAGLRAETLATRRAAWDAGRDQMHENDVLIVEQAGRIGSVEMADLLERASVARAKVVLVSDRAEMAPAAAGEPLRALERDFGALHLDVAMRQREEWQRDVARDLLGGRSAEAIGRVAAEGRIHWGDRRSDAIAGLAEGFVEAERGSDAGSQVAIAARRADVRALNESIRSRRVAEGLVDVNQSVRIGRTEFAVGDQVLITENLREQGLRNGETGHLVAVRDEQQRPEVRLRLASGREIAFEPGKEPQMVHGYAVTAAAAQSLEVDRAHVLAGPGFDAPAARVALTRHVSEVDLHAARADFASEESLAAAVSREPVADLVSAHAPEQVRELAQRLSAANENLPSAEVAGELAGGLTVEAWDRSGELLDRVSEHQAVFTEGDLVRAAPGRSVEVAKEALASDRAVLLWTSESGVSHYTSAEYLVTENRLFETARAAAARSESGPRLAGSPGAHLDRVVASGHLSEEQRAAVEHLVSDQQLTLMTGRAGTGKSRSLEQVRAIYETEGYRVLGAAPSGKASDELQRGSGIESRTLASLEHALQNGRERLSERDVLVVDEAGMVGTRDMDRLLQRAQEARAKVILVGDPQQLPPVAAGRPFEGLVQEHGAAHLGHIRRQKVDWQRQASQNFAEGRVGEALLAYAAADRVVTSPDRAAAVARLAAEYRAVALAEPGKSQLAMAYRNVDVDALNEAIRADRVAAGELGPGVKVAGREFAAGDRLVFLRNDNHGQAVRTTHGEELGRGVKNGSFGTVTQAADGRIDVRLDSGRRVAFDPAEYDQVKHGYASTLHRAQGATVDRSHVLADRLLDRHAAYVAMTRHREDLKIYTDQKTFPERKDLEVAFAKLPMRDLARDYRDVAQLEDIGRQWTERAKVASAKSTAEKDLSSRKRAFEAGAETVEASFAKARVQHQRLVESLGGAYRRPVEATAALAAHVDRHGVGDAVRLLKERPLELGKLRGGALRGKGREQALAQARRAGDNLRNFSAAASQQVVPSVSAALAGSTKELAATKDTLVAASAQSFAKSIKAPAAKVKALARELRTKEAEAVMTDEATKALKSLGMAAASQALGPKAGAAIGVAVATYRAARTMEHRLMLDKGQGRAEDMRDRGMGR